MLGEVQHNCAQFEVGVDEGRTVNAGPVLALKKER